MTSELADDHKIKAALEELNRLIGERVKREQRSDQLTGLPNGLALDELLDSHVENGREIWAAFIEVDRFKSTNDRFGYARADELLKALAGLLSEVSKSLPGNPQCFRQHGDEFFIVGAHDAPDLHRADVLEAMLSLLCEKVRRIAIPVVDAPDAEPRTMSCTVSVGWLVSSDVVVPQTRRAILDCLERAVDEAKRLRDRSVRYSNDFQKRLVVPLRADCPACRSKFSVDVPLAENRPTQALCCPNCGHDVERPEAPDPASGKSPVQV